MRELVEVVFDFEVDLDCGADEVAEVEGEENSLATEADSERWDCRSWRAEMEEVRESCRVWRRVVRVSRCADGGGPEVVDIWRGGSVGWVEGSGAGKIRTVEGFVRRRTWNIRDLGEMAEEN